MYRHSASFNMAAQQCLPSPAPDELSDGEAAIVAQLDRHRHQIDAEIAAFKAHKEQEFRDFERDLRRQRKRSRSPTPKHTSPAKTLTTTAPSALSLLGVGAKPHTNGSAHKKKPSDGDRPLSLNSKAPPSKPTLSLDKLTINGTTTPPIHGTPPANARAVTRTRSRSPSNANIALTPPRSRDRSNSPTATFKDRNDFSFAGLFTPAYLPLLDHQPRARPTAPADAKDKNEPQTKSEAVLPLTGSLSPAPEPASLSTSLPDDTSPTLLTTHPRRTLTVSLLPSTSLPSALRTASGTTMRKRKKVTFQLSDSAIVEPSSSYEELPSPDPPQNGGLSMEERNGIREIIQEDARQDPFEGEPPQGTEDALLRSTETQTGFFPVQLSPSKQRTGSADSTGSIPDSKFSGGLQEAEDGGSGVGFFELDEELESPGVGEPKPYSHVEDVKADEVLEEPGGDENGKRKIPAKEDEDEDEELKMGSFTAGSVPIAIVNRGSNNSWFGSYGH